MNKMLLSILVMHSIVFGMEDEQHDAAPAPITILAYRPEESDFLLWGGIERGNYNEVLQALDEGANQNYVWTYDDANYQQYVDLTAVMFAIKQLRKANRHKYVSTLASAAVWDVGEYLAKNMLKALLPQYPMLSYAEPVWNSRTADMLLGTQRSQRGSQAIVQEFRPEKELLHELLVKENTRLTVRRHTKPETALTYLNSMQHSWNPLTREDGRNLSYQVSLKQLRRLGMDRDQSRINIAGPLIAAAVNEEDPLYELAQLDRGLLPLMRNGGTTRSRTQGNSMPTFFQ